MVLDIVLGGFAQGGGELINPDSTRTPTGTLQWPLPVAGTITSQFGHRVDPITGEVSSHTGTDIACAEGTPILAAADGIVTVANGLDSWGGSYGYYVNDKSAMGLTDKVSDGDRINAFVYTDTVGFSDVYCYFDNSAVTAAAGEKVTLTLLSAGYDANWQPVVNPVAGATVTVDGKSTELKTDADGKVTVTFDAEGTHTVSAVSGTARLVPPVCVATVTAASAPVTGDNAAIVIVVAAMAFAVMSVAAVRRKKADEK